MINQAYLYKETFLIAISYLVGFKPLSSRFHPRLFKLTFEGLHDVIPSLFEISYYVVQRNETATIIKSP
jgi:hypothetical protein